MKLRFVTGICIMLALVVISTVISCQSEDELEFKRYYTAGSLIYQSHCQNCHGAHGEGLNGLIPPLSDSTYIKNNKITLACTIKFGLKGKITVSSKLFEGQMPPNDLPNIDIAKVLTYVGNSFGNKMGTINSQQVDDDMCP